MMYPGHLNPGLTLGMTGRDALNMICRPGVEVTHPVPTAMASSDLIGAWRQAPSQSCPLPLAGVPSWRTNLQEVDMMGEVAHQDNRAVGVVVGVDTHKDEHVAVAIDGQGARLGERRAIAATCGYEDLERWSRSLGEVRAFGIEGTGSYGVGIARFMTGRGYAVIEVNRPDRATRYLKGKSDPTDAESAARAVLAGVAGAIPKSGDGEVEMIRMLKSAKDSAVKARTQAINQMKALVVTAPDQLREALDGLTAVNLAARCARFRVGRPDDPTAAAKYALRSLARRYRQLTKELRDLESQIARLTRSAAPALVELPRSRTRHGGNPSDHCRKQP